MVHLDEEVLMEAWGLPLEVHSCLVGACEVVVVAPDYVEEDAAGLVALELEEAAVTEVASDSWAEM